ncbi:MAG: hypothetical protein ACRDZQ_11790, partial [Acidimicrobiales bacterium]
MAGRARSAFVRHWLFALILAAGLALRVLVDVAYWPTLLLFGDSYSYLGDAHRLQPQATHPLGYPLLLRALSPAGSIAVVPIVQHLLGMALGVLLYVLLLR